MNAHAGPRPTITIAHGTGTYPVFIGRDILHQVARAIEPLSSSASVVVVTSENLAHSYGERVAASFEPRAPIVAIPDGEQNKSTHTALHLVEEFVRLGLARDSLAVIVGGGVTGDTAGFAAAIYLRGIDVVQIPTTLLAQVDSSIGGKVAVNLRQGKNLVGAFHAPLAVICDVSALETLDPAELRCGAFESLKAAVIGDPELFALLERDTDEVLTAKSETMVEVVTRSVSVKAGIVQRDEREGDRRRLLNYGHTIGHAIETVMKYEGITHGEAVGWGMIAANAIAQGRGILDPGIRRRIDEAIFRYEPCDLPRLESAGLLEVVARDKKFHRERRVMILPRDVGQCEVFEDIGLDEIELGIRTLFSAREHGT